MIPFGIQAPVAVQVFLVQTAILLDLYLYFYVLGRGAYWCHLVNTIE